MRIDLIKIFLEKNKQINLSAIRDADGIFLKHIKDALELEKILKIKNGKKICDIGTGGGFPLLPLAIKNKGSNFVGIDARRKKVDAVNDIIKKLGLNNVECKRSRIEDFDENFDYITARAVGYIDKIIPWSYGLLKKGGSFILYKQYDNKEYQDLQKICKKYKLDIKKKHKYKLFEGDIERIIYVIKKK
ncbi:MAG TPA: 16S rRNA (guanine(527)-N(7))-methyltransferase RsmG [Candidatus Absconditabacterales bacterium]|nr:16S rRNA (guanine(527)-N(7))-methyltransferase RsmG [Candidatus Absconditabacterales bacterium]